MELVLFNTIPIKNFNVNVIERNKVIPMGMVCGLKLYTNGVLVVGMSEIEGIDGKKYKIYDNIGIEEGDVIVKVNDVDIKDTNGLFSY